MAFDEAVAERVREALKTQKGVAEKQMFGGIAFMLRGHMLCGVLKSDLILRLGDEQVASRSNSPTRGQWILRAAR